MKKLINKNETPSPMFKINNNYAISASLIQSSS